MKYKTVPITVVIDEAFEDVGLSAEERNISLLKRTVTDTYRELSTTEQLVHKIVLLETDRHGKVEIPDDLKKVEHVSYRLKKDKHDCTTREKVIEWTQKAYNCANEDFDVTVSFMGDVCTNESCYNKPLMVNVDDMWLRSNPQYSHATKFGVAHNITDKMEYNRSYLSDKFKLMLYSGDGYFRLHYHIDDCANMHCLNCDYKYSIQFPYLLTDLPKETEVLLSYLGEVTDSSGDIMVPDHPDVLEALKESVLAKNFRIRFLETGDKKWEYMWKDSEAKRDIAIGRAKSSIGTPSGQDMRAFFSNIWMKRVRNTSAKTPVIGGDPYKKHLSL